MASIPQYINPTNDPTYEGRSQRPERPQTDTSAAGLIGDIGKTMAVGVEATDTAIKNSIRDYIRTGTESIRDDEFGVRAATQIAADRTPPTNALGDSSPLQILAGGAGAPQLGQGDKGGKGAPQGVVKLGNTIEGINEAYKSGMLSESYYLARLNNVVEGAKQAYGPGYWDDIDTIVHKQTGVVPANALRKQLQQDLDNATRGAGTGVDKQRAYLQHNAKYLGEYGPTAIADWASGKVKFEELESKIVGRQIGEFQRNEEKADITDDAAIRETKGKRLAAKSATTVVNQLTNDFTKQSQISDLLDKVNKGGTLSTDETKVLENGLNQLEVKAKGAIHQKWLDDRTYEDVTDGKHLETTAAVAMSQITTLKKSLADKDFGALTSDARHLQRLEDKNTLRVFEQFPTLKNAATLGKLLPPTLTGIIYSKEGGANMVPLLEDAERFTLGNTIATKGAPLGTVIPGVTGTLPTDKQRTDYTFGTVRSHVGVLTSPDTTAEQKSAAYNALYRNNDGFIQGVFHTNDFGTAFMTMYNPAVTEALKKGDPYRFEKYGRNAVENASVVMSQEVRSLAERAKADERYKIYFNPDNNRVEYVTGMGSYSGAKFQNSLYSKSIEQQVNKVNGILGTLQPIIEASPGRDNVTQTFRELFKGSGIVFPDKPKEKNEDGSGP